MSFFVVVCLLLRILMINNNNNNNKSRLVNVGPCIFYDPGRIFTSVAFVLYGYRLNLSEEREEYKYVMIHLDVIYIKEGKKEL